MASLDVKIQVTDLPVFRRLVAFLEDVETLADERTDIALQALVYAAREDLLRLMEEKG